MTFEEMEEAEALRKRQLQLKAEAEYQILVTEGHGSVMKVGERYGKWKVDEDFWWFRKAKSEEAAYVEGSNHGFYSPETKRLYVRSKKLADRVDRGIKLTE